MKILFLDQSGTPGGAELCLLDIVKPYRESSLVGLLADGPFRTLLADHQIPVKVFTTEAIKVRKESSFLSGIGSLKQLLPLVRAVSNTARQYDLIYANTPKALVVGALASFLSRRPLVYHLHDIISPEHFSRINRWLLVTLANQFAALVIANSKASQSAFVTAGGDLDLCTVIYNGFNIDQYVINPVEVHRLRETLGLDKCFLVGHFSRLSSWKGQHVLLTALTHCPDNVKAILVGDALFGEQDYVQQLHQQVEALGLDDRVQFLGFRSDIPQLMSACNLVAHTSTAPEPFGRVIVEAMLCKVPVVAAAAGGAIELISPGETGWLCSLDNPSLLAAAILNCQNAPTQSAEIAQQAHAEACSRFKVEKINQQLYQQLLTVINAI